MGQKPVQGLFLLVVSTRWCKQKRVLSMTAANKTALLCKLQKDTLSWLVKGSLSWFPQGLAMKPLAEFGSHTPGHSPHSLTCQRHV